MYYYYILQSLEIINLVKVVHDFIKYFDVHIKQYNIFIIVSIF